MGRVKKPDVGAHVVHRDSYSHTEWAGEVDWCGSEQFAFITAEGNRRYCRYDADWSVVRTTQDESAAQ